MEAVLNTPFDQERFLDFLLHFATMQTSVGVQTSRIVLNTTRIAEAYGYSVTIMLFQRNVAISIIPRCPEKVKLSEYHKLAHTTTALTHHSSLPLNFQLNAELTRLSWWAKDTRPSLEVLERRFEEVLNAPRVNRWLILTLTGLANAAFCRLFNGDLWAMLFVFLSTLIGFYARQELNKRHTYQYFVVLVASALSSMTAGLLILTGLSSTPQIALSTSVLYLIPGVPIINGIMDFFDGYMMNGISRLMNALFIVGSIAIGVSVTVILLNQNIL